MGILKRIITIVIIGGIVLAAGCSSGAAETPAAQVATVQRGDITEEITGVGNLALSEKVDLAFEIDGTVQEVLVAEAQSVSANQVMARLDTTAWEQVITNLEDAATNAERTVTSKQRAVTAAQRNVTTTEQAVTQAERNVSQAERDVVSKEYSVLQAQINLNNARLSLEQTEETSTDPLEIQVRQLQVELAEGNLESAQQNLEEAKTTDVADAQQAVEDAKLRVEDAKVAVDDAQQAVKDSQKVLEDARQALEDAKSASPEVRAPFDGFITSVNVVGGDDVKKGTVAMTIANPNKFEAEVMVSEVDILKVNVGGPASVLVEAMPGSVFPAMVTQKAPSATIQSGVVTYKVKVDLTSLEPLTAQSGSSQATSGDTTQRAPSGRFPGALNSDNMTMPDGSSGRFPGPFSDNLTREEVTQMFRDRQQSTQQAAPGAAAAGSSGGNAQLAEGMTVTVNIIAGQSINTLLVPVQAVVMRYGETFVQVVNPVDGSIEDRPVEVGISNWEYAEILSGLSEGEQVIVPLNTAPTSQQQGSQQPRTPSVVPSLGRVLR